MKQVLGLIEVSGLPTAVATADTMARAANIHILETEDTKGLGYMTIKIAGNVGAVNTTVNAGGQIGAVNNKLVPWKVTPKPPDYVERAFCCPESPVPSSPPIREMQKETGTGKTREIMQESPETAEEPEPNGRQADSVREGTGSRDEPQVGAEQPSEGEGFKLAEKPKEVSRRTPVAKGIGTARSKNN